MVNEVRTLLLNVSGTPAFAATYPGEEFVPDDFVAINLPLPLRTVHQALFGYNPDRAMYNYRLRQYMTLLHSGKLASFVTDVDPRITYWPARDTSFFLPANFGTQITKIGATDKDLYPQGGQPAVAFDKLLLEWYVTVIDGSTVHVQQLRGGTTDTDLAYTISSGVSSILTLPGTSLGFFFEAGVGSAWLYRYLARPAFTITHILEDLDRHVVGSTFEYLFGGGEPYLTFKNIWQQRKDLPYRMGAILLAQAYKTRELR